MKYRVRVDMSFDNAYMLDSIYKKAEALMGDAVNINQGEANQEISCCSFNLYNHDATPNQPCVVLKSAQCEG